MKTANYFRQSVWLLVVVVIFSFSVQGQDEEDDDLISPVRPTVSESATIQKKGVLQLEYGGDFDFDTPDFRNQQSAPLGIYFAVNKRLRLDFELETIMSQEN
jgi:hypothetical protein